VNNPDKNISAIVPFYNEERSLGGVVDVLISSGIFSEIILVNDGSTDSSVKNILKYSEDIILIDNVNNMGKGYAVSEGIKRSSCDIVIFIDADLLKITPKHLQSLVDPLIKGNYDGSLGYTWDNWADIFFKSYGGQRAYYKKDLVDHLDDISESRYGLELLLNQIFKDKKIREVKLRNAGHIIKPKKRNETEFVNETIVWVMDVGKQLLKLKIINKEEYRILSEIKNMRSIDDIKKFVKRMRSKNLRRYVFSYVQKFLKYVGIYEVS
jgi:glycosyltransferase involved in cell wall biosynthesis